MEAAGSLPEHRIETAEDPAGPSAKTAELRPLEEVASNGAAPEASPASTGVDHTEPEGREAPRTQGDAEPGLVAEAATAPVVLSEEAEPASHTEPALAAGEGSAQDDLPDDRADDLGEVFGRVMALSLMLDHPAIYRAIFGFADNGRVYLVYPVERLTPLARRPGGLRMSEGEALAMGIQLCQVVALAHRRGLRANDLCPESIALDADGRLKLTGLDYVSNDLELQDEPIFNDGYTAPEIYRAKQVDKRADIFAIGAVLYACLTGERLEAETWREEAGPVRFYPPHVVTPAFEQVVRRAILFDPKARIATVDALKAELLKLAAGIRLRAAAVSDVGMVRELNEDAVLALEYRRESLIEPAQAFLYVVADGMGGAEAGEIASALAVGTIRAEIERRLATDEPAGLTEPLRDALEAANQKILDYAGTHPEARGLGSTAVGALMVPPNAAIAWVGDSRAYLLQPSGLRQLSKDHSLVQRLIEIGQITAEEARHHEHKNVITRSLGARPTGAAGAEAAPVHLKRGDRMLLCSDGLTAHVEDGQIAEILQRHADPYDAARELIVAANAGGGTDNVSVVVIFAD
jgi:protein phosphatase